MVFGKGKQKEPWNKGMKDKYKLSDIHKNNIAIGLKNAYLTGRKNPWNKYKTNSNISKIKVSESLKKCYKNKKRICWNKGIKWHKKINNQIKEKHPNWQGGKSLEKYGEEFNKRLKNIIRERDNQVCMNCGIHREKLKEALTIHHINYDKKCNLEQNLISLCRNCHGLTNFNKLYWTTLFQERLSKLYDYKYDKGDIIIDLHGK
jgi:hypothetical protein